MLDLINLLDYSSMSNLCDDLAPILRIVGIVLKLIQYTVPILLILFGMLDFAKAVTEKNDDKIKESEKKLLNRAIAAIVVFLVIYVVSLVMGLVSGDGYKECMPCVQSPFGDECKSLMQNLE